MKAYTGGRATCFVVVVVSFSIIASTSRFLKSKLYLQWSSGTAVSMLRPQNICGPLAFHGKELFITYKYIKCAIVLPSKS